MINRKSITGDAAAETGRGTGDGGVEARAGRGRGGERGSALLIALWALLVLAASLFEWARLIDAGIALAQQANRGLEAKAYAHSGMAVALHPLVTPKTALLEQMGEGNRGYSVRMIGEGGKINLNWVLQQGGGERVEFFKRFLDYLGLDFREREALVDSLLDWLDGDTLRRMNGAEESGAYRPPNRGRLEDVAEVRKVNGSAPLVSVGGWERHFTLYSSGPIDLLAAPLEVLRLLPGIGEPQAQRFLQLRRGPDGKDGTADDFVFKGGLNEALSYLGVNPQLAPQLAGMVSFNEGTWHIESVGSAGKVYRQVEVVARKAGGKPLIFSWQER